MRGGKRTVSKLPSCPARSGCSRDGRDDDNDAPVAGDGGVGGAEGGAGGVRGVAGCAPGGAVYGRGLPRLLRRGGLRRRRGFPVCARHLPLLPAPRLPPPPQLAPPARLGKDHLLRRRFARWFLHRHYSETTWGPREDADLVRGGLAVQPLHVHNWHEGELRADSLRRRALGPHMFDEGCRVLQAAFWYGLIVHFRIYPIIYAVPFVIVLGKDYAGPDGRPILTQWSSKQQLQSDRTDENVEEPTSFLATLWIFLSGLITRNTILFGLFSGSMFFAWTGVFFYLYGWDFLNEALLYHLTRTDPRHNFSIYFYHIYLHHQQGFSSIQKLASFLPQLIVQLALIVRFSRDLPFCLFLQTVAFVAFNKVMTAQYFVWFFCLLPLILPWTSMKLRWKGLVCMLVWMVSQLHWLMWAYLLEFKGRNVFVQLWVAGLVFLAANTFVMIMVIRHHKYTQLLSVSANSRSKVASKKE